MQPSMNQPFTDPQVGSGEPGPAISELDGRVVAFVVKNYNPNALDPAGKPKPSVTADVFVIDGGPLQFGGNYSLDPREQRAPYLQIQTPARFADRMFSGVNIVRALQGEVGKGPVLGVVVRSEVGQRPWNLDKLTDADPRRAYAGQFWSAMMTGQWANPTAHAIPGRPGPAGTTPPPTPGAPVPNPYAQAPALQQSAQQFAPQAPVQQFQQPPAPAPQYMTQPAPLPPYQPAPAPAPQQFAPQQMQPAYAPAAPGNGLLYPDGQLMPAAPQGYEQVWPTMTREQHSAVLAQVQPPAYGQGAPQARPNMY